MKRGIRAQNTNLRIVVFIGKKVQKEKANKIGMSTAHKKFATY